MTQESNAAQQPQSIREIVAEYAGSSGLEARHEALIAALYAREDNIGDLLRLAGQQFGMYPQIVSEVLAQVGVGTPLDETTREFIRAQFVTLMQQLREQHGH